MDMVRAGVMFSLRLASCWRVEVVKGGAGLRSLSCRFTLVTEEVVRAVSAAPFSVTRVKRQDKLRNQMCIRDRPWALEKPLSWMM